MTTEVERHDGWVIFQDEDGTYWANVLENACSDPFDTIEEARRWALDMLGDYRSRKDDVPAWTDDPGADEFNQSVDRMEAALVRLEEAIARGEVGDFPTLHMALRLRLAIDTWRHDFPDEDPDPRRTKL